MTESETELHDAREAAQSACEAFGAAMAAANAADRVRYEALMRYRAAVHKRFAELTEPIGADAEFLSSDDILYSRNHALVQTPIVDVLVKARRGSL